MRHDSRCVPLLYASSLPEFQTQKIYELGWWKMEEGNSGRKRRKEEEEGGQKGESCNDTERMNKKTDCLRTLFVPRSSS